ncbi:MAG: helix-turn-helix transcriptional regulator [Paludisphaera borealis]|uniref:helix-turn-helix domain-containing protein n=1 Tax=Paludisphaera borealis TaxID=1387353 RepID=UPI00283E8CE5|nr:helix-turn-helix transcriptional regulator [Paludisphaera borealis]MDR3620514.1 helix-turn-helix transcriptional regulator [Paludisphaera borealis]
MTLKEWRKKNRYTLPAFVTLLEKDGNVKVTTRTVHNWETGFTEPSIEKLEAIRLVTEGQVLAGDFLGIR